MKISVILPCYNAGAYLSACLDSLLAQSMRDFEVIFVDDGSRDDSLALARLYAERDVRIHVFSQENQGVSAARNLGLAHARDEWITFVDGDDLLPPDAFETLLSGAAEDVDMVVCPHETFDETGRVRAVWPETRWYRGSAAHKRRAAALRLIEGDSVLNIMCGKLIRREMIERERLRLVSGLKMAEDALFNLVTVWTHQSLLLTGMLTEAVHTPLMQDRYLAIENAKYIFNNCRHLGDEVEFKKDGIIQKRAQEVLGKADDLLAQVEKEGLFSTIEKGIFGGVKRPFDGGHGLEGVCTKGENYFNPFIELFMDHE